MGAAMMDFVVGCVVKKVFGRVLGKDVERWCREVVSRIGAERCYLKAVL
jgi:hypothetical protein